MGRVRVEHFNPPTHNPPTHQPNMIDIPSGTYMGRKNLNPSGPFLLANYFYLAHS
ncbi:hypothetical protein Hanom_Chr16g01514931 [Helianthus anomalus]